MNRFHYLISGQVQGVGFRPFVHRIAGAAGVCGYVRNDASGAEIEAQGSAEALRTFERALRRNLPPLARVSRISRQRVALKKEAGFAIEESIPSASGMTHLCVDTAVCPDCVRELLDTLDRRGGYALINCTQCGPRYSIIDRTPYDRPNTSMAGFRMCGRCEREYTDRADRRFHAQPIACHDCGPRVELVRADGERLPGDPVGRARDILLRGGIVALKGLGAFHLATRADAPEAVRRLRENKHRPAKPLAVMVGSLEQARAIVELTARDEQVLRSPQAPILLCRRRPTARVCDEVAPGNHRLGIMLPYTPLHHLLLSGGGMPALVMTSGNDSGEPLVIDNADALARLGGMCDALLQHDRPIRRGIDDSVLLSFGDSPPLPIRRARGYVPSPVRLPVPCALPGVAVGADLKSALALAILDEATLSQHLGDLSHPESFRLFVRTIDDLLGLFNVEPRWIAHDLHPGYFGAQHAVALARGLAVPAIPVQHHHAHAASVLAEHGRVGPALAIVCDGTGYGPDGSLWGGELLVASLHRFERVAHLKPLRLPGGDACARDPRRSAAALLHQAFGDDFVDHPRWSALGLEGSCRDIVGNMIRRNVGCIASSSAGRLFDGIAALLGVCMTNRFDAEAPLALESAADAAMQDLRERATSVEVGSDGVIDCAPLVRELLRRGSRGEPAGRLAAAFHEHLARGWADAAVKVAAERGLRTVALSGGVFCNAVLTERLTRLLVAGGLEVLTHQLVPPNDGGIALGQAAIAAASCAVRKAG